MVVSEIKDKVVSEKRTAYYDGYHKGESYFSFFCQSYGNGSKGDK